MVRIRIEYFSPPWHFPIDLRLRPWNILITFHGLFNGLYNFRTSDPCSNNIGPWRNIVKVWAFYISSLRYGLYLRNKFHFLKYWRVRTSMLHANIKYGGVKCCSSSIICVSKWIFMGKFLVHEIFKLTCLLNNCNFPKLYLEYNTVSPPVIHLKYNSSDFLETTLKNSTS